MTTRRRDTRPAERGIALVMAILVVTLLAILVVEFTYSTQVESHMARNSLGALQAGYLARSGINILAGALTDDNSPRVDPDEEDLQGWGSFAGYGCSPLPSLELPPYWRLCVRIVDESGKINVNWTRPRGLPGGQQSPPEASGELEQCQNESCWVESLRALFAAHGVDESVATDIADYWLNEVPEPEPGQPAPLFAPEFASLEDAVARFSPLRAPEAFTAVRDFIAGLPASGGGAVRGVNVNTAPVEVLSAILRDYPDTVARILSEREEQPYASTAQALAEVTNPSVKKQFDVRSAYFRLEASAMVNGIGRTVRAFVRRDMAPPGPNTVPGTVPWKLTFLDWQKEGGAALFAHAGDDVWGGPGDLDAEANSGNNIP